MSILNKLRSANPDRDECLIWGRRVSAIRKRMPSAVGRSAPHFVKWAGDRGLNFGISTLKELERVNQRRMKTGVVLTLAEALAAGAGSSIEEVLTNIVASGPNVPSSSSARQPHPQPLQWGPMWGKALGLHLLDDGTVIGWPELKRELEDGLLGQCLPWVPLGSVVKLIEYEGKANHIIRIVSPAGADVGNVYFGQSPRKKWQWCGLVWVGPPHRGTRGRVWRAFARYSDGSYRIIDRAMEEALTAKFVGSSC